MIKQWNMPTTNTKVMPKRVFAELPDSYKLSPEEMKYYDDNGFLVIKELIDFASLYSYKQRFQHMCNGLVDKGNMTVVKHPSLVNKKLKPEQYIEKISELLYDDVFGQYGEHPRILDVLTQLIGEDITAMHSMFINKPPGSGEHPPHQDLFYFPFRPADKIIASWTAVDHVTEENGCLYVIPGSHKSRELYAHGSLSGVDKKQYHGILKTQELAPPEKRINLEMSPGDTVFFHPYLIHGSKPNVSKNYRKAITFHFANSSCYYVDVRGTVQEQVAQEIEQMANKRGYDMPFDEIWRLKSKQVKGVRSNL